MSSVSPWAVWPLIACVAIFATAAAVRRPLRRSGHDSSSSDTVFVATVGMWMAALGALVFATLLLLPTAISV